MAKNRLSYIIVGPPLSGKTRYILNILLKGTSYVTLSFNEIKEMKFDEIKRIIDNICMENKIIYFILPNTLNNTNKDKLKKIKDVIYYIRSSTCSYVIESRDNVYEYLFGEEDTDEKKIVNYLDENKAIEFVKYIRTNLNNEKIRKILEYSKIVYGLNEHKNKYFPSLLEKASKNPEVIEVYKIEYIRNIESKLLPHREIISNIKRYLKEQSKEILKDKLTYILRKALGDFICHFPELFAMIFTSATSYGIPLAMLIIENLYKKSGDVFSFIKEFINIAKLWDEIPDERKEYIAYYYDKVLKLPPGTSMDFLNHIFGINRNEIKKLEEHLKVLEVLQGIYREEKTLLIDIDKKVIWIGGKHYRLVTKGNFAFQADKIIYVLTNGGKVIIRGPKGIGKSILARYILEKMRKTGYVPIEFNQNITKDKLYTILRELSSCLFFYDPSSPLVYEKLYEDNHMKIKISTDLSYPSQVDVSTAISDIEKILLAIKDVILNYENVPVLIVIPTDVWNSLSSDVKKFIENTKLFEIIDVDLKDYDFLREIIHVYSGSEICENCLDELVNKIMKFNEGYTLIAKIVGETLRDDIRKFNNISKLLEKALGNVKNFIKLYLWEVLFGRDHNCVKMYAPVLLLHAYLGEMPVKWIDEFLNVLQGVGLKLSYVCNAGIPTKLLHRWFAGEHEDLIEETIKELVDKSIDTSNDAIVPELTRSLNDIYNKIYRRLVQIAETDLKEHDSYLSMLRTLIKLTNIALEEQYKPEKLVLGLIYVLAYHIVNENEINLEDDNFLKILARVYMSYSARDIKDHINMDMREWFYLNDDIPFSATLLIEYIHSMIFKKYVIKLNRYCSKVKCNFNSDNILDAFAYAIPIIYNVNSIGSISNGIECLNNVLLITRFALIKSNSKDLIYIARNLLVNTFNIILKLKIKDVRLLTNSLILLLNVILARGIDEYKYLKKYLYILPEIVEEVNDETLFAIVSEIYSIIFVRLASTGFFDYNIFKFIMSSLEKITIQPLKAFVEVIALSNIVDAYRRQVSIDDKEIKRLLDKCLEDLNYIENNKEDLMKNDLVKRIVDIHRTIYGKQYCDVKSILTYIKANISDVLGWIYLNEEKLNLAEKEFERAKRLFSEVSSLIVYYDYIGYIKARLFNKYLRDECMFLSRPGKQVCKEINEIIKLFMSGDEIILESGKKREIYPVKEILSLFPPINSAAYIGETMIAMALKGEDLSKIEPYLWYLEEYPSYASLTYCLLHNIFEGKPEDEEIKNKCQRMLKVYFTKGVHAIDFMGLILFKKVLGTLVYLNRIGYKEAMNICNLLKDVYEWNECYDIVCLAKIWQKIGFNRTHETENKEIFKELKEFISDWAPLIDHLYTWITNTWQNELDTKQRVAKLTTILYGTIDTLNMILGMLFYKDNKEYNNIIESIKNLAKFQINKATTRFRLHSSLFKRLIKSIEKGDKYDVTNALIALYYCHL